MKQLRRWVARRVWDVGQWLFPYSAPTEDDIERAFWTMDATYIGTEKQADDWFERLCGLDCEGKHGLHDCRFAVGGMQRSPLEEESA